MIFNIFRNYRNFIHGKIRLSFSWFQFICNFSFISTYHFFFPFPHAVEYFPMLNCVIANNWFDQSIPTFNRGIVNQGINWLSGKPFYPLITYPGNKKFNHHLTSNPRIV